MTVWMSVMGMMQLVRHGSSEIVRMPEVSMPAACLAIRKGIRYWTPNVAREENSRHAGDEPRPRCPLEPVLISVNRVMLGIESRASAKLRFPVVHRQPALDRHHGLKQQQRKSHPSHRKPRPQRQSHPGDTLAPTSRLQWRLRAL